MKELVEPEQKFSPSVTLCGGSDRGENTSESLTRKKSIGGQEGNKRNANELLCTLYENPKEDSESACLPMDRRLTDLPGLAGIKRVVFIIHRQSGEKKSGQANDRCAQLSPALGGNSKAAPSKFRETEEVPVFSQSAGA